MDRGVDQDESGLPQRKRLRLPGYDYTVAGGYFITVDVADRVPLLGRMQGSEVQLNEVGGMVSRVWNNLPHYYPGIVLDAFVIMPEHIHGIVILADPRLIAEAGGPTLSAAPTRLDAGSVVSEGPSVSQRPIAIPTLMRRFKSYTTNRYHRIRSSYPNSRLPAKLWQRSYYERVIRSESDFQEKRDYIVTNPQRRWLKNSGR